MSDTEPAVAATRSQNRCPACGQSFEALVGGCCPLCEHVIETGDATSEDHTPYAAALSNGVHGYRAMCRWVWTAGKYRLNHLGLCQPSAASRRFARINVALFGAAVGLAVFTNTGWHRVTRAPGTLATSAAPTGRGWWRVVTRPVKPSDRFADALDTELWWNIPRAVLTAVAAGLTVLLGGLLLVRWVGWQGQRALRGPSHQEPRLTCAVAYSTAWLVWPALAALLLAPRPLARMAHVGHWAVSAPPAVCDIPAAILSLAGLLMWWFWLIRLAQTTPKDSRASVGRSFLIWTPLEAVLLIALAVLGYRAGAPRLADALNLVW